MVHHRILSYQFLHKLCNKKFASLERRLSETFHLANDILKKQNNTLRPNTIAIKFT